MVAAQIFGSAQSFRGHKEHSKAIRCQAASEAREQLPERRDVIKQTVAAAMLGFLSLPYQQQAHADLQATPNLCDEGCEAKLQETEWKVTKSGLKYKIIDQGEGSETVKSGYQAVVHYVGKIERNGLLFENSVAKDKPFDVRVGSGQLVPGLEEGIQMMKPGAIYRFGIPSSLSFKNRLAAAPGRPVIQAGTPLIMDVFVVYVPGMMEEDVLTLTE